MYLSDGLPLDIEEIVSRYELESTDLEEVDFLIALRLLLASYCVSQRLPLDKRIEVTPIVPEAYYEAKRLKD